MMLCMQNILISLWMIFPSDGRNDYSEDAILDNDEFFEGTENILPKNNWHMTGYDPKLLSHGNYFKVEPGSTVKMSCTFTNLSDEFLNLIIWRKLDRKNTLISQGGEIRNHNFEKKATVSVDSTGSTLLLAPVEHVDAGMYQCALDVGAAQLRSVHNVEVYISPELESRNWSHGLNSAQETFSYKPAFSVTTVFLLCLPQLWDFWL